MTLARWNPWQELEKIRAEADQLLDDFLQKLSADTSRGEPIAFLPEVDILENEVEYRVYLSVPGLIEEDVDLVVGENKLLIRGERHAPYDPECTDCRTREWRYGCFEREITFPNAIEVEQIRAKFDAGVLSVFLLKKL